MDPSTGQFLTVDPLVAITHQPYEAMGDNPISNTDPTGLHDCGWTDPEGCVANVASGATHAVSSYASGIGTHVTNAAEVAAGVIVITGADLMASAIFIAGFPEDVALLPAETGLLGYVLAGANLLGLGLIADGLHDPSIKGPTMTHEAPGQFGNTYGNLTGFTTETGCNAAGETI